MSISSKKPSFITPRTAIFLITILLSLIHPVAVLYAQDPLQSTTFTPNYAANTSVPLDPLGNPAIFPSQTIVQPASLTINGGSLQVPTVQPTNVDCIASVCSSFQLQNILSYASYLNLTPPAQPQCTPDQNPNEIVQCSSYNGAVFPRTWETAALTAFVLAHGLPASAVPNIFQYGRSDLRDDVRGFMLANLLAVIRKQANGGTFSPDEQNVYNWLTELVWGRRLAAAQATNAEYQTFLASPCYYTPNQAIESALSVNVETAGFCPGLQQYFASGVYPPVIYFQAIGQAAVPALGAVGEQALTLAQQDFLHSTLLATQQPNSAVAANNAYYADFGGIGAIGPGAATYQFVDDIRPFANRSHYIVDRAALMGNKAAPAEKTVYETGEVDESATTADSSVGEEVAEPIGEEAAAATEEVAADAGAAAAESAAAGVDLTISVAASTAAGVVGIVLFAIEVAVTEGIQVVQSDQNQADDATLPAALTAAQQLPDLTQLITTSEGYNDICNAFIYATLPDYPSSAALPPANTALEGWYSPQATLSFGPTGIDVAHVYFDNTNGSPYGTDSIAYLWNGWIVQTPGPNGEDFSFGFDVKYYDQNGIARRATRVAPNLFEVEPQTNDPNAPFCPLDPSLGITDPTVINPDKCASAVTNYLKMTDNGVPINVYLAAAGTITSSNVVGALIGSNFAFQPTVQSPDPLNQVPCTTAISGSLPNDISVTAAGGLAATAPYAYAPGTYNLVVTATCGADPLGGGATQIQHGISSTQNLRLVAGTHVVFNSTDTFNATLGVPFSAVVATKSNPLASLRLTGTLPPGLMFKDNGNGTATISGTPTQATTGPCTSSCPVVVASDVAATVTEPLNFTVTYQPTIFTYPAPNQTIPVITEVVNDAKNIVPVATSSGAPVTLTTSALGPYLSFVDNGNGTGTFTYNSTVADPAPVTVTVTATACCGVAPVSESVKFLGKPVRPAISQIQNGPLAQLVGAANDFANFPLTVVADSTQYTITPGPLPKGLSWSAPSNGTITLEGTPAVGTGGFYQIPTTVTGAGITDHTMLGLAIYEAPRFYTYDGAYAIVFHTGTAGSFLLAPYSGFPLGPFNGSRYGLGVSGGLAYAIDTSVLPSGLSSTPFAISSGTAGSTTGSLSILFNGQALTSGNDFHLPLVTQVTTGPVPGHETATPSSSDYGTLTYTDQAKLAVHIYVVPQGDANLDGKVTCTDLTAVRAALNIPYGQPGYSTALDLNGDGVINIKDVLLVSKNLPSGTVCH